MPWTLQDEVKIIYKGVSRLWSYEEVATPVPYCFFLLSKEYRLRCKETVSFIITKENRGELISSFFFLDVYADH